MKVKQTTKRNFTVLTLDNVKLIKQLLKNGYTQTEIALRMGVARITIHRIAKKKTWVDI